MTETESLQVEATGETVGEAKWTALRELEKLRPGIDKAAVRFQVVSEGERGLLGVGFTPARVVASVDTAAVAEVSEEPPADEGEQAAEVRGVVEHILEAIGVRAKIEIVEDEERLTATVVGRELGLVIGKHGQTIDAIQYIANAIARAEGAPHDVVVDAAGYRARRTATLEKLARRTAQRASATGRRVALDPMTPVERKIVHEALKDDPEVETSSEGTEPNRFVVVFPRVLAG